MTDYSPEPKSIKEALLVLGVRASKAGLLSIDQASLVSMLAQKAILNATDATIGKPLDLHDMQILTRIVAQAAHNEEERRIKSESTELSQAPSTQQEKEE